MFSIRRIGRFAPGTLVPLFAAVVYGCTDTSSSPNRVSADSATPRLAVAASGSGLVAAYGFDEASGTATTDASGNSNNGATGSGVSRTTSGRFGGALSFDGSGMVTIPDAASLRLTSAMTLEAWVNPSTVNNSWRDVIYKGDDNYYLMATSTNGSRAAGGASFGNTSATIEAYGTSALAANTWSHLAVTFDGTTIRLYVNGAQVSTRTRSGAFTTSSNPLQIGGNRFYGQYFQGKIDEVRVYNRSLSATEIQSDMNTAVTKGSSGGSATLPPPVVVPTAKALAIQTQPGSATSALPFVIQPIVRIADSVGGVIAGSTAQVTAALASGSGTLSGTTTVSAVNGVASFTNLTITGSGNSSLKFTSGSLTSATSSVFAVSAPASKPASQLAITAQPSTSATSGVAFAQQPSIVLRDASGSTVAQAGLTVTAAIATGGGTLGGTTSATTNASGVATFGNLSIAGTTGNRTLSFASGSMTGATSNAIAVTAVAAPVATQVGITAQATSGQSGAALSPATVLQLKDASGNAVGQSGVTVTATLASGTATLGGTLSATTAANGSATFSNIVLTGSGTQTLRFSTSSGFSATSAAISIAASAGTGGSTGGGSTGGAAGNILNNASFESGWEGFTNWTGAGTPSGVTRDNSVAYDGGYSIKREWTPNPSADGGSQFLYKYGATDRVWLRYYVKLTAPVSTIMKFSRFYDQNFGQNLGGIFLQSGSDILGWGWDVENSAIVTTLGISQAQLIDGKWHSIQIDYWRNGDPSGQPSVAFWFDGVQLQGAPIKYAGSGNNSVWKNGRLYAGERAKTNQLGYMEWLATLNAGNTTTGQVNIDRVSYSTSGPIAP